MWKTAQRDPFQRYRAFIRRLLTAENVDERRLARAVCSQETDGASPGARRTRHRPEPELRRSASRCCSPKEQALRSIRCLPIYAASARATDERRKTVDDPQHAPWRDHQNSQYAEAKYKAPERPPKTDVLLSQMTIAAPTQASPRGRSAADYRNEDDREDNLEGKRLGNDESICKREYGSGERSDRRSNHNGRESERFDGRTTRLNCDWRIALHADGKPPDRVSETVHRNRKAPQYDEGAQRYPAQSRVVPKERRARDVAEPNEPPVTPDQSINTLSATAATAMVATARW